MLFPKFIKGTTAYMTFWCFAGLFLRFFLVGESHLVARFILPTHALAVVLAVILWARLRERGFWQKKLLDLVLLIEIAVPNLAAATLNVLPHLKLNAGLMTQEQFLENYYPNEGWDMVQFVNRLAQTSRIAVLDHHATPYYYKDAGRFLWQVPYEMLKLDDPRQIKQALLRHGITHALFITSQWQAFKTAKGYGWNAVYFGSHIRCRWWEQGNLTFLKPVYQTKGAVLFHIRP
ncbi:MAG: hypothetical protein HY747_00570 [Elusimicrobia bacterium]|nr:hypothetical protein [Elusimicrobiota bacterium]